MKILETSLRIGCGFVLAAGLCVPAMAASGATRGRHLPQSHAVPTLKKASVSTNKTHTTAKTNATHKKASSKRRDSRSRGQKAPTTDRVREIQEALAKNGAYPSDPTGKWDAGTVDAMKKFQQANGLEPSGKLTALTLQKLGLGSDVAGRASPRPEQVPTKQ